MWTFGAGSNIEQYNLINKANAVLPNYDLSKRELSIELHFSPQQEVCIIGRLDNNYMCWCSLTDIADRETNEKIFNQLVDYDYRRVSQEYLVFSSGKYSEMNKWYRCEIKKSIQSGILWETPFGHVYGEEGQEHHGSFFAGDIIAFRNELLEKCSFRNNDDLYRDVLQHYHTLLSKTEIYEEIKPIVILLEQEAYLRMCPDETVRNLYLKCMERGRWLYNRYMDRVR